jgi:hypothetical protein
VAPLPCYFGYANAVFLRYWKTWLWSFAHSISLFTGAFLSYHSMPGAEIAVLERYFVDAAGAFFHACMMQNCL